MFYAFKKGCRSACIEEFNAIIEFTGWSKNTVFAVFFIGIFIILLLLVFGLYKYKYKKRNQYRQRRQRIKDNKCTEFVKK